MAETGPELLREWRGKMGGSQASLARSVGCDPSTIRHYELGRTELGIELAVRVSKKTGISLRTLIGPEREEFYSGFCDSWEEDQ